MSRKRPAPDASAPLASLARRVGEAFQDALGSQLVSVVLFGSVAREEATADSDLDLLVVGDGLPRGRAARAEISARVLENVCDEQDRLRSRGFAADVSIRLMSRVEAARTRLFYLDIAEDGVLLYDRDGFFAGVLDRVRERIRVLGAKRLRWGRVRFWDLKPDFRPGEMFEVC